MIYINRNGYSPLEWAPVPPERFFVIEAGVNLVQQHVAGFPCESFARLPGGKTLRQMLEAAPTLHYFPKKSGVFGEAYPEVFPYDFAIGESACIAGIWTIAGAIVHELAHLNGAPGTHSHAAEQTLRECGLEGPGRPYDPGIMG